MKTILVTAAAIAATLSVSAFGKARPPRLVHLDIASAQSQDILAQCIKEKNTGLNVKDVPIEGGGVTLEFSQTMNLFRKPPMEYWTIVPKDGANHITLGYRHPMSEKTAAKLIRMIGRKCFPYELEAAGGGKLPEG